MKVKSGLKQESTLRSIISFPTLTFQANVPIIFSPLQWIRTCLSFDLATLLIRLVVDGQLLAEKGLEEKRIPEKLNIELGWRGDPKEKPGKTTDLNIFSSELPIEIMKTKTIPGAEECGLPGDFLSWEDSMEEDQWKLHSRARITLLDGGF